MKLTAGFLCEKCKEPKLDRCCKLPNSCCSYILGTYLVRKIQRKYCTALHSVCSRNVNLHSLLVLEQKERKDKQTRQSLPALLYLSLSAGFVLGEEKGVQSWSFQSSRWPCTVFQKNCGKCLVLQSLGRTTVSLPSLLYIKPSA